MSKLGQIMTLISNAESEELYEEFCKVADPDRYESKEDLGKSWENLIGYNPIHYHDTIELELLFDDIVNKVNSEIRDAIKDKKDIYVEKAINLAASNNTDYLALALLKSIQDDFDDEVVIDYKTSGDLDALKVLSLDDEDIDILDEDEEDLDDFLDDDIEDIDEELEDIEDIDFEDLDL